MRKSVRKIRRCRTVKQIRARRRPKALRRTPTTPTEILALRRCSRRFPSSSRRTERISTLASRDTRVGTTWRRISRRPLLALRIRFRRIVALCLLVSISSTRRRRVKSQRSSSSRRMTSISSRRTQRGTRTFHHTRVSRRKSSPKVSRFSSRRRHMDRRSSRRLPRSLLLISVRRT